MASRVGRCFLDEFAVIYEQAGAVVGGLRWLRGAP